MVALLLVLLLIALLFGAGFATHILWVAAVVVLVLWLVGFLAHGPERRWYRW
jgi:O-antigen/teichoic acid export membrane protein